MSTASPLPASLRLRLLATAFLEEFTRRVDQGESVADMFDENAVFASPRGEIVGPAAISDLFRSLSEARRKAGRRQRHFISNVAIRELGDGRLEARSMLVAYAIEPDSDGTGSMLIGDQTDILIEDGNGGMRFLRRGMTPAMHFNLPPAEKKTT